MEIYLDNSATTKVCAEAEAACLFAMREEFGNPSSLHKRGFEAEKLIDEAKKQIANLISCDKGEIFFTSGATESNNLAILGRALSENRRGNKIITTAIEHPSVLEACAFLEKRGYEIVKIYPDENGKINPIDFYNAVDEKTILVSAMMVNNETGYILPVGEIAKAVKRKNKNVCFHVDAVQGFLKLPIKLKNSDIDLMSISGHKVYAPKGVGAIYIKKGTRIKPLIYGGNQQNGLRSGTESVPLISAFGASVKANGPKISENLEHYKKLRARLLLKLSEIPDITVVSDESCAPFIVSLSVKGIRSEIMLHFLEQYDIFVSSGSACSKGGGSYVLSAFGVLKEVSDEAIRLSFSRETTEEMLDVFIEKLKLGTETLAKKR